MGVGRIISRGALGYFSKIFVTRVKMVKLVFLLGN